jgi:hypothetical protein
MGQDKRVKKIMRKIIFLVIFGLFLLPSSAFALNGMWLIKIDKVGPLLNYLEKLNKLKGIAKVKTNIANKQRVSVNTSYAGGKTPAVIKKVKTASAFHFQKPVSAKFKEEPVKKKVVKLKRAKAPSVARIVGKTDGLPVLTVDFVNKPLWKVLQDVSNDTGYVFTTKGVNLAEKVNLKGRYNFAVLLSKLFNGKGENTTVNLKTKRVKVNKEDK